MVVSYRYKAYRLNDNRNRKLDRMLSVACSVYNHCIALHKRYYRIYGKYLYAGTLKTHLTKLQNQTRYKFWRELSSQSIQAIAEKIDEGYKKFFRRENKRPPTFRKRSKYKSILFKNTGWKIKDGEFHINKQNLKIKYFNSRKLEGDIATITVKKDSLGDTYLSFSLRNVTPKREIRPATGKIAGFDFGLKTFLTSSEQDKFVSPEFFKKGILELKKKSRGLSKKQKGSKSRKRARTELARFHRKIVHKREDYQWKLAHQLSDEYDILCFENLHIKAMQRLWGRKINDYCFSEFLKKLKHICNKKQKKLVKIDRFYPSSKTCNNCGHIKKHLNLRDRFWTCESCNTTHDRDINAAINIKKVGASTLGRGQVRPALAG